MRREEDCDGGVAWVIVLCVVDVVWVWVFIIRGEFVCGGGC